MSTEGCVGVGVGVSSAVVWMADDKELIFT